MDGDLGPLPELCALAEEFGCIMMVDDAHASGVFGRNGRGTIDHFDVHGRVDVQVGTLSKAIGALGGYVAGSRALIDFLYHRARPFLFSTSHPPAVAAACIAAIDVLLEEPQLIERLWDNTRFFKAGLRALGFDTGASESPITPVIVGDGALAMKLSDRLFARGRLRAGHRVSDRRRATRPASAPSSPRRTRATSCSSRSTPSPGSAGSSASSRLNARRYKALGSRQQSRRSADQALSVAVLRGLALRSRRSLAAQAAPRTMTAIARAAAAARAARRSRAIAPAYAALLAGAADRDAAPRVRRGSSSRRARPAWWCRSATASR